MHDDFIRELKPRLAAKDMRDKHRTWFGQPSTTRLRTLHLKWMKYDMDSTHTAAEHLCTISAMVCDLKAAG